MKGGSASSESWSIDFGPRPVHPGGAGRSYGFFFRGWPSSTPQQWRAAQRLPTGTQPAYGQRRQPERAS